MHWRLAVAFVAGGVIGATYMSGKLDKDSLLAALVWFGGAYSQPSVEMPNESPNQTTSEYLVILKPNASTVDYRAFIEAHPQIEYLSRSIYPNTIRVALRVPVTDILEELNGQPFVGFAVRNLPIFFCH